MRKWLWVALAPALAYLAIAFIVMEVNPAQWTEYGRIHFVGATAFSWIQIAVWDLMR